MANHHNLSRRETQIMDLLYAEGELTVNELQERLPDPPTPMSIRTFLRILDEKGLIKRRKDGRGYIYSPKVPRRRAAEKTLQKVIHTFFDGSVEQTIGACLASKQDRLTPEERERLHRMIDQLDAGERTSSGKASNK